MDLAQLEQWMPGETGSRAKLLNSLIERMKPLLPEEAEILPLSYNDIECMWITLSNGRHITSDGCLDILDGFVKMDVWFDV